VSETLPVFICGALRSGSTMFHLMLDSHPNISNPGEFDFLFDAIGKNGVLPDTLVYKDYLSRNRIFNAKKLSIDSSLSYQNLINSFIEQLSINKEFLALNIHRNFDRAGTMFPKAKFIHLLRDPRDVARSSIGMNWAGNVYYGVNHWIDTEESWDKLRTILDEEQYLEVRFEDLISNTKRALESVCQFIGVEFTDNMFDYQHTSTYSKPDIALINQWQRKLSQQELQNVESKVSAMMKDRNYPLSGHPIKMPSFFERIMLSIQNKFYKASQGIKRYGFILYASYRLSERAGIKSLHNSLLLKVSEIDKRHLRYLIFDF